MLEKKITYTDFDGKEKTESFFFNLTDAELTDFQLSVRGGIQKVLETAIKNEDTPLIIAVFKDLIRRSYGEVSADGRHFYKEDEDGHRLFREFASTNAYSVLYMELATNMDAGISFLKGIIPKNLAEKVEKMNTEDLIPE